MVRVAMNTSNFLGQTGLCKSSIAQSRMCCIALFSASGNPSVQKVPIPQASALKSKKHFAKMRSLHPSDAEHKGFGHSPTSILNLDFEIRFKNRKLVPSCTACDVDIPVNCCVRNFKSLQLCEDIVCAHAAGQQLFQHVLCFGFLCGFRCFGFSFDLFSFDSGDFLIDRF